MSVINPEKTTENFAAELKEATAARHSKAEHSNFMSDLMGGKLSVADYVRLLGQYQFIYEALESVSEHYRENPTAITAPFVQPGLDRAASIKNDLAELGAPSTEMLPATAQYVEAILATRTSPERYLAHHYLRYLGDLSGGQAVAALVARHYGVPAEALSMYRFPDLPKPKVFKDSYRQLLNDAPMDDAARAALIDEAIAGFDYNAQLFAQLS